MEKAPNSTTTYPKVAPNLSCEDIKRAIVEGPDPGAIVYDLAKRHRGHIVYPNGYSGPKPLSDDSWVMNIFGIILPWEWAKANLDPCRHSFIVATLTPQFGPIEYVDKTEYCDECGHSPCVKADSQVTEIIHDTNLIMRMCVKDKFQGLSTKKLWGLLPQSDKLDIRSTAETKMRMMMVADLDGYVAPHLEVCPCLLPILEEHFSLAIVSDPSEEF